MENSLYNLIEYLLSERNDLNQIKIPDSYREQRILLRALLNIRLPKPIAQKWIDIQDLELQVQLNEKGVMNFEDIEKKGSDNILLWQGDITRLNIGAIVNAANSQMLGCFIPNHKCIDNAIHSAAGLQLREECNQIMIQQSVEEPTGSAKITKAYNLPANFVLHTVGPIITQQFPTIEQETQLASCYDSCLDLAEKNGVESVAFCCISTGEFRFPNDLAAQIAVNTVKTYLKKSSSIKTVVFNVFKDQDYEIYSGLLR